jgi:hypothetical protein
MAYEDDGTGMSTAFARLRWMVFDDPSKVQVVEDVNDLSSISPDLSPLSSHPLALEAASVPPLREIKLCSFDMEEYESDGFKLPDPVVVGRVDGGVITVMDVVEQLSAYLIAHKDMILEAKAAFLRTTHDVVDGEHVLGNPADEISVMPPADTKVFFDMFWGKISEDYWAVSVQLWAEGEHGESMEQFWSDR